MATIQPDQTDQLSSGLTLNLSSNNPFRNRAVSPGIPSPVSPFDDPPPRPVSRNPFLDPSASKSQPSLIMADKPPSSEKATVEDFFASLTFDDKPASGESSLPAPPKPGAQLPPNRENVPPAGSRRGPPPNHRPTRSQEEALRARKMQGSGPSRPSDPSRSPQRRMERRPRRNSDSSARGPEKPLTDEEKKEREARRRARERRHREGRDKKTGKKLDIIDQLDATSIFGTGLFHHDGPFDALNPHRNRDGSRRAPMQAFPKDSLNNVLGGSGPLTTRPDHATFMGNADEEAFKDYNTGSKDKPGEFDPKSNAPVFDPTSRGILVHGDETVGLGTSTFLEGTPAARSAIQRNQEERVDGLQRKKSLAQRIRGINRGPRDGPGSVRVNSNRERSYSARRSPTDFPSSGGPQNSERNPFFQDYDDAQPQQPISHRKGSSSGDVGPRRPERRTTSDAGITSDDEQPKQGSGILARVKSLKGGRRQRPSVSDSSSPPPPHSGQPV